MVRVRILLRAAGEHIQILVTDRRCQPVLAASDAGSVLLLLRLLPLQQCSVIGFLSCILSRSCAALCRSPLTLNTRLSLPSSSRKMPCSCRGDKAAIGLERADDERWPSVPLSSLHVIRAELQIQNVGSRSLCLLRRVLLRRVLLRRVLLRRVLLRWALLTPCAVVRDHTADNRAQLALQRQRW
jgi:hypothetical protein